MASRPVHLSAAEKRLILQDEAMMLGFELAHADLRAMCAHLRRGTEVRYCYVERHATEAGLRRDVQAAIRAGKRLDHVPGSKYYMQEES